MIWLYIFICSFKYKLCFKFYYYYKDKVVFFVYYRLIFLVEFRFGDEIIIICVYFLMGKNRMVMKGEVISDEMCYGFLIFYFKENLKMERCI